MPPGADRHDGVYLLPNIYIQPSGVAQLCCNKAAGAEMLEEQLQEMVSPGARCMAGQEHGAGTWAQRQKSAILPSLSE